MSTTARPENASRGAAVAMVSWRPPLGARIATADIALLDLTSDEDASCLWQPTDSSDAEADVEHTRGADRATERAGTDARPKVRSRNERAAVA